MPPALPTDEVLHLVRPACPACSSPAVVQPTLTCAQVHTKEYVHRLNTGTLDDAAGEAVVVQEPAASAQPLTLLPAVRRIGFGELTRTQVLIDRTKAEVAGELLCVRLKLDCCVQT